MSRKAEEVLQFRYEPKERLFWETHDSSGYVDWSKAERVRLPRLKPSAFSLSRRGLPVV